MPRLAPSHYHSVVRPALAATRLRPVLLPNTAPSRLSAVTPSAFRACAATSRSPHIPAARSFSASPACAKKRDPAREQAARAKADLLRQNQTRERSVRVAMSEAFTSRALQDDFGLLPDTMIMPTGANKPSFFSWPRARLRLEYARLRRRVRDYFYVLAAKWYLVKPRPKLRTRRIPRIAQALQRQMYTALADGDEPALYATCCKGLAESLAARLRERARRGERWSWQLRRYRGRARVVSHKIAAMPIGPEKYLTIRQAVVRIRSVQSLARGDRGEEEREVCEYLVVQQMWGGPAEHEAWKVWGTVEEDGEMWKQYA